MWIGPRDSKCLGIILFISRLLMNFEFFRYSLWPHVFTSYFVCWTGRLTTSGAQRLRVFTNKTFRTFIWTLFKILIRQIFEKTVRYNKGKIQLRTELTLYWSKQAVVNLVQIFFQNVKIVKIFFIGPNNAYNWRLKWIPKQKIEEANTLDLCHLKATSAMSTIAVQDCYRKYLSDCHISKFQIQINIIPKKSQIYRVGNRFSETLNELFVVNWLIPIFFLSEYQMKNGSSP